uniref:Lipase domain-containing protein n=1 Tax=Steinernema glaseri TaxID=37863 RepID=A0A1I7Z2U1_9BILA
MIAPVWSSLLLIYFAEASSFSDDLVYVYISGEVWTDECLGAGTNAEILLWLGTLDIKGNLTRLDGDINLNEQRSISAHSITHFAPKRVALDAREVEQCVEWGHDYCFPHADVLFVHFNGSSEFMPLWVPVHFIVRIEYEYKGVRYDFTTDHPMTHQCRGGLEEGWYQIGPRHGMFISLGKRKPEVGDWIRDWV